MLNDHSSASCSIRVVTRKPSWKRLRQAAELNDPNDSLDTFIGLAYFGKRDYEKALSYIDHDITIRGRGYENSWDRALILYAMERYEDAEEEISSTIETDPSGKGNRYYLRALIPH